MSRKRSREPTALDFEETTEAIELREFGPRRCRHLRAQAAPAHRQLYQWAARRGDILGTDRYHLLLCVTCCSMLEDFAELEADWTYR